MVIFREIVDPMRLASAMSGDAKLRRGAVVFVSAAAAYAASSLYYIVEKLDVRYASPEVKLPSPPITEPSEAVFSSVLYLSLGFLVVAGVFSVIVYLKAKEKRSLLPVFSSTMHGFLSFIIATLLLLPALLTSHPLDITITYAEFEEVKIESPRIVGVLRENESALTTNPEILRSPRIVYNASSLVYPLFIESAEGRFGGQIVDVGDVLAERLDWERMEFSGFSFSTTPTLSREPLSALATVLSWMWVIFYVGVVCKRYYGISSRDVAISISVAALSLLIFGLL